MSHPAIGESVGRRYRILEVIGTGGIGTVYKAIDTRLQRLVALKVLHFTPDAESKEQFSREVQALARLNHPNIVQIYDVSLDDDLVYMTAEYIEGRNLRHVIADARHLDLDYAIEIVFQVGIALGYAHRRGIIHRDIKPENVLIPDDGRVRLLDFGLAIAPGTSTLTGTGTIIGTTGYMSPEQVQGKPVDARSDLFSLGIVFYELLTGCRPFSGESATILMRNISEAVPVPPQAIGPSIPSSIEEIVLRLLAKQPDQRFQSVEQLLTQLSAARRLHLQRVTSKTSRAGFDTMVRGGVGAVYAGGHSQDERSATSTQHVFAARPPSVTAAMGRTTLRWVAGVAVALLLGSFAFALHDLGTGVIVFLTGGLALWSLYCAHLLKAKRSAPVTKHSSVVSPPLPPLNRQHGSENWDTLTTPALPYSPPSAAAPEIMKVTREMFGSLETLSNQKKLSADIPVEVRRRLEEFDAIWNQLTSSARHD